MDLEQFTMLLEVQLPNCVFWRLLLQSWCLEACCDSMRWGLPSAEAWWSHWTLPRCCHFGQRGILRWRGFVTICSVLWPVLDAIKSVLYNSIISISVILDSSRFYPSQKYSKPHIPGLAPNVYLPPRNSHKRSAIARAISMSDFLRQSTNMTSGRKTMFMYACASNFLSRCFFPHGGFGGYVSSILSGRTLILCEIANSNS